MSTNGTLVIARWKLPPPPDPNNTPEGYVDVMGRPVDYHVILLASMGFTHEVISRQTGLTLNQVQYRLAKINHHLPPDERLNSINYRQGRSKSARAVINNASSAVARVINAPIRWALADDEKEVVDV